MPTTDEPSPFDATATTAPSADDTLAIPREPVPTATPDPTTSHIDSLSPAVRRLVRQFDLDITGIHGSGPEGRIRVGDLINLLGGRTDSGIRDAPRTFSDGDDTVSDPIGEDADAFAEMVEANVAPVAAHSVVTAVPTSTVFDCDLSRVLSHRKKLRRDNIEVRLASYFLAAFAEALETVPELAAPSPARFGVLSISPDGEPRSLLLDPISTAAGALLGERLRTIDGAMRATTDVTSASVLVHHYGESGSLLATPTPIGTGHAGSLGIGRVRREIVVRTMDGVETPRVAARCYLSLSFLTDRIAFLRANQFLAHAVHVLEQWPDR